MEAIEKFRQNLKENILCLGASITLTDPLVTEALSDSVDFIWVDLEHSIMSPEALAGHLLAARSKKIPALVRVVGSGTPFIKPVLDLGADGIIVPQVRNADEVRQIVEDCRYAPLGRRGYGPRVPSNYGRDGGKDYVERSNKNLFVAVMIENLEAFKAIDEILSVPGLDSIVIGPMDLSEAFGVLGELENISVISAIHTIISKTRNAGLSIGIGLGTDIGYACTMIKAGIQWIQLGCDFNYMINYLDSITSSIRNIINENNINK